MTETQSKEKHNPDTLKSEMLLSKNTWIIINLASSVLSMLHLTFHELKELGELKISIIMDIYPI